MPLDGRKTGGQRRDADGTHEICRLGSFTLAIALLGGFFAAWPCALHGAPAEEKATLTASVRHFNLGPDKLALKGFDPVAYFTRSQALKGRKELSAQYRGVTYWFASEEDQKSFQESPDKYLPTYGGWCATAMAKGEKVEVDPTNFKVTNGRLFLFFKAFYANALKDWNKDEARLTANADANWKKISGE